MKRLISFFCCLLFILSIDAQEVTGFDIQQLADEDIIGSSRYMGLSGAMAALGGDVSAVKDNPASLGVFQRSELSISISMAPSRMNDVKSSFSVPTVNWVLSLPTGRKSGVVQHNLMFAYNRQMSYQSDYNIAASNLPSSQTDVMADMAQGLRYTDFQASSGIGWLAYAGFDGYLIDTLGAPNSWVSVEDGHVNATIHLQESGHSDDYSLSWGLNCSHRWYVGLGLNIRSLSYLKQTNYSEQFVNGDAYELFSSYSLSGVGVGCSLGLIWRPKDWVRLGAAIQTPTFTASSLNYYGTITSTIQSNRYSQVYRLYNSISSSLQLPFRVVMGAALQIENKGLLSLEYDYAHASANGMRDQHLLKFGGEWAPTNHWFIDLGFAIKLYGNNYRGGINVYQPDYESIRLDTDQRENGIRQYASIGASYRSSWLAVGLAYQFSYQSVKLWAHELQTDPMDEYTISLHRLVVTLGLRYRK